MCNLFFQISYINRIYFEYIEPQRLYSPNIYELIPTSISEIHIFFFHNFKNPICDFNIFLVLGGTSGEAKST